MIRVAVVDDEALVRSGFEMMLATADGIEVVASVDGVRAINALQSTRPDVVLLDIRMPGVNGLDILDILRTWPDPPTVAILTTFDTDAYIMQALGKGAAGFLVKDTDPEELPGLIRSLARGAIVLSPQVSRIVVSGYIASAQNPLTAKLGELTAREQQVLTRLTMGESNTEIGRALHLSVGTIKDHVSAILLKLNVSTRLQAAVIAERANHHPPPKEFL